MERLPLQDIPKELDFVIILCPNTSYTVGTFEESDPNGVYIGGPVRMQAAVDLYNSHDCIIHKYIAVGGGLDAKDVNRWKKTENMKRFLIQEGIPGTTIACVASGADTLGNIRAIWVTHRQLFKNKTVGILSNAYHLPRAIKIVTDPQFIWDKTHFFALPAEELVIPEHRSSAVEMPSLISRQEREEQGMIDWQQNTYTRQHLPVIEWRGELLHT